jgi:hypothetical protein
MKHATEVSVQTAEPARAESGVVPPVPSTPASSDPADAAPPPEWTPDRPHPQPLREAFCAAYAATPNATRAAVLAGYAPKTARQQGWRLLRDPFVLMRIEELRYAKGIIYELPRDLLLDRAEMLFWQAVETNNAGAALGAVRFQAKLAGHTMPGGFPPRPSPESLHLIGKMASIYTARRFGKDLSPDEQQFATSYSPRWRYSGKEAFDDPMEDIHRHYTEGQHEPRPKRGRCPP